MRRRDVISTKRQHWNDIEMFTGFIFINSVIDVAVNIDLLFQ